jgi:hypothetical protein
MDAAKLQWIYKAHARRPFEDKTTYTNQHRLRKKREREKKIPQAIDDF